MNCEWDDFVLVRGNWKNAGPNRFSLPLSDPMLVTQIRFSVTERARHFSNVATCRFIHLYCFNVLECLCTVHFLFFVGKIFR